MPCNSRVTQTQMLDRARVVEALKARGLSVVDQGELYVQTADGLMLSRSNAQVAFVATGYTGNLASIGRKYAELSVRSWAKGRGLAVRAADEKSMTLVSTRS